MLKKIIFLLSLLSIVPDSNILCKDKERTLGIGVHFGSLAIPGNYPLDSTTEWPSIKYGFTFSYKLNDYISIQLESGYTKATKIDEWESIQGLEPRHKKETTFKGFPIIEGSILFNMPINKKVIFFMGPGIGYQKIKQDQKLFPLDASYPTEKIIFSGFTVHILVGCDLFVKPEKISTYFHLKQKIGTTDYSFNYVRGSKEYNEEGQMSLSGFEIVIGFRYFI